MATGFQPERGEIFLGTKLFSGIGNKSKEKGVKLKKKGTTLTMLQTQGVGPPPSPPPFVAAHELSHLKISKMVMRTEA